MKISRGRSLYTSLHFFLFAIFVFFIFKNEFIVKKALLGIFAFSLFWTLYDHLYYSHKRTFWNGEFEISTYSPDSHLKYLELMGLKFFNIYSKALGFKVMNNITLDEEVAKLNFQKDGPIICSLRHKCRSSASIDKESINPNAYKIISYGGSLAMGLGLDHLEDTYILKSVKYLSPHLKQYDDIITYSITQGGDETDEKIKFLFDAYHKIKPNLLIFSTFHQPSESQLEKLLTIIYQALKNDVKVLFVQYLIFPKPTEDSSFVALDKKIIDQFKKYPNFSTYNPHSVDFNFIQNYFGKIWIDRVHLTVFGHQTLAKCLSKTLFKAVGVTNIASRNFLCDLYQKEENQ